MSDPLLIKAAQPESLFSLKVFFLYISNLCQPQKILNRVTFLTEQRCSELQERTIGVRPMSRFFAFTAAKVQTKMKNEE